MSNSRLEKNMNKKTEENQSAEINPLQAELDQALLLYAKAEEEVAGLKDQLLRMAADSENLRKRSAKQVEDASKFAVNGFAKDLIDALENLYLATNAIPAERLEEENEFSKLFKGVEMTKSTFLSVFEKHGIKRIFPNVGDAFDHNFHEAVAQVPQPDLAENAVVNVMRAGYALHERLIKPAMVVVSKAM